MEKIFSFSVDEMIKQWLLNLAVECPVWLSLLFPTVDSAGLNTKPVPRCNPRDYAKALSDLFDSGMIGLSSEVSADNVEDRRGFAQVLDRFLRLSPDDSRLSRDGHLLPLYERNRLPGMKVSFKLTDQGGAAWEEVAEPDWGRYISVSTYSGDEPQDGELVSADRDLLIAYMGWYPEVNGEQIQLDTIKWQTHTDFEVLYWKRLPFVHHASFKVLPAQARWNSYREPEWFQDWWVSTRSWHKQPWELPNWPSE